MSKIRYIWITLGVVVVCLYLVWSVGYFVSQRKGEVCGNVVVLVTDSTELQFVSVEDIERRLHENRLFVVGERVDEINTAEIEKCLLDYVMLKAVECYKTPENDLVVEVTQRVPRFRVIGADNYYVDADRAILPISSKQSIYVPVVTGSVTREMALNELFDFVDYVEGDSFMSAMFTQINVCEDKSVELIPRLADHVILLGKLTDDYESRLEKLRTLYVDGFAEIGWVKYKTVDLRYKNQVVCNK